MTASQIAARESDPSDRQSAETKFYILMGVYVGAWGLVPGITPKLIPLDLSWVGLGVLSFSLGAFIHAITFPCTDAVAEVWGAARARLMVYVGFSVYVVAIAFYLLGAWLPPAPGWEMNEAFVGLFGSAWRLVVASMAATVCAQLLDIAIFERVKRFTGERNLWIRNNASTAISQLVDTTIFYSIAFYGVIPNEALPLLILGTYLVKIVITIVDTPVVYLLVRWITGHWTAKGDI
ncbi:MAG: queuosine precursor transporter [Pseudomonadota bacterium]